MGARRKPINDLVRKKALGIRRERPAIKWSELLTEVRKLVPGYRRDVDDEKAIEHLRWLCRDNTRGSPEIAGHYARCSDGQRESKRRKVAAGLAAQGAPIFGLDRIYVDASNMDRELFRVPWNESSPKPVAKYAAADDAEVRAIIIRAFAAYGREERSLGFVRRELNDSGFLTVRGKLWTNPSLREMLQREEYVHFGYIDRELFEAVQKRLKENEKPGGKPSPALLVRIPNLAGKRKKPRPVLHCVCGSPMTCANRGKGRGYQCRKDYHNPGTCAHASAVDFRLFDRFIISTLFGRRLVDSAKLPARDWERDKLRRIIRRHIATITFGATWFKNREGRPSRRLAGEILFITGDKVQFTDADIDERNYHRVARLVEQKWLETGEPATNSEIAEQLDVTTPVLSRHISLAIRADMILYHPTKAGLMPAHAWISELPARQFPARKQSRQEKLDRLLEEMRRDSIALTDEELTRRLGFAAPDVRRDAQRSGLVINNPNGAYGLVLNPAHVPGPQA